MSFADGPLALAMTQDGGPDAPRLSVMLAGRPSTSAQSARARRALDRLLGLSVDLSAFAAMAATDPVLGPLARRMRGLKPPRFPTVFEALVNGVACQQLSLAVGIHLLNRLTADYGRAAPDDPGDVRAFPDPDALARLEPDALKRHGFSMTKARTIIETARAIAAGDLDLEGLHQLDDPAAVERLTSLRGIGRWTAEYVLLRGLGRLHVFPGDDVGAHNKLRRLLEHRHAAGLRERPPPRSALAPLRRRRLLPSAARLARPGRGHRFRGRPPGRMTVGWGARPMAMGRGFHGPPHPVRNRLHPRRSPNQGRKRSPWRKPSIPS